MKTAVIVQARLGSTRLPRKVLKKINGKTLIEIIYARLSKTKFVDQIIFSIPNTKENNELEAFLRKKKFLYFRGDENDVLSRYYQTAKKFKIDNIVRITGDCPLVDYEIVDEFIKVFLKEKKDYVSNCNPWTYPDGLDTEVFSFKLLSHAQKKAKKYQRLNGGVLISFLKENKNLNTLNIKCPIKNISKYRLTVDEEADFILIKKIYDKFYPNIFFGLNDIIKMIKKNKKLLSINSKIKQNTGSLINRSQKIWIRANAIILGGNSLLSKNPEMFLPNKWPTYFSKAKGIKVWDLNKKFYYDMSLMGVGTNILGYANKEVDQVVKKNIADGNMSTLNCYEEVLLAEKLIDMHPWASKAKFARTGGEANSLAIRIARAAAGKDKVAFCGYHGWHDWYLSANLKQKGSLDSHLLPGLDPFGVPKKLKNTSFGFKYGDITGLKKITNIHKIGVIKMEVQRNTMPNIKFLKQVRELATKKNIVLIFDECTSGFRQSFGGLHKSINVIPDMAIFGKALGNGYAITAVLGKDEVMEKAKKSFMSSTFWTERIGPTAALKTLEIMERDSSWLRITNLGNKLISIWKRISKRHNVKIQINGLPALAKFSFLGQKSQEYKTYLTQEMLKKGFLAANGVYMSTAHDEKILKRYENLLDEIFFTISKCQKGNVEIEKILLSPVSRIPFSRLN